MLVDTTVDDDGEHTTVAITINPGELQALRRATYRWVDDLTYGIAHRTERVTAGQFDDMLARVTDEAVGFSWGTSTETATRMPRVLDSINDVAIAAGTVDPATGAAKARDGVATLQAARRAHGAVQGLMMELGLQQPGHYFWPS